MAIIRQCCLVFGLAAKVMECLPQSAAEKHCKRLLLLANPAHCPGLTSLCSHCPLAARGGDTRLWNLQGSLPPSRSGNAWMQGLHDPSCPAHQDSIEPEFTADLVSIDALKARKSTL